MSRPYVARLYVGMPATRKAIDRDAALGWLYGIGLIAGSCLLAAGLI